MSKNRFNLLFKNRCENTNKFDSTKYLRVLTEKNR